MAGATAHAAADPVPADERHTRQCGRIADKLSDLNDTPDVDVIADAPRPVPLSYEYTLDPMEKTVELAFRNGETPIMCPFLAGRPRWRPRRRSPPPACPVGTAPSIAEAIKGVKFTTAFGKILQRLLRTGVGIHHAGMLPRYRRLVEQLAQQGLLPVICGTDTLGVGINVPIHSVVLTALTKFDGTKMRRLRAREFHQIAGRAGRMGFDTEGLVIAEAPEYEIENQKAIAKAGGDPKKLKKVKRKKAPEGFVTWNQSTFDKLIDAEPETLVPHLKITHSMVLNEVAQGGDARARIDDLIDDSAQTPDQKEHLHQRADEIFQTLFDTEVIETEDRKDGGKDYYMTLDMPGDFALDQPLSPFLLAALELLDPESDTYALDVISMAEATLEDPKQVLRAQERQARDKAMADMKADGLDYDERMDKLQEITYPKPLEDMLESAFDQYRHDVPWPTTTADSPQNPWCATWWKPPPTSPDTSPDTTSPAPKVPCCATSRTPTARWRVPCRPKSVTSNSKTSSPGCACSCAPSTPRWWMNGRTPAIPPTSPRRRPPWRRRARRTRWSRTDEALSC